MDISSIFSQFGSGKKETVYLSVTPGVGLELIQVDIGAKTVKAYASRPLAYNESLREITDMEEFKNAVVELFEELHISLKSNIVLNLPMALFGSKNLPLLLADDGITEALISEVEKSYIFKRYEPMVDWVDAPTFHSGDTRKLFYTAIQKNTIDSIKAILTELGATLISVKISLISVLKALAFSDMAVEQMKEGVSWNLMLISQSGYSICSMVGKTIVDYYEEPLAIKSFEGDEIYNAITASAQITLMSYPANYLYIISETNMVSAELLAARVQADGIVSYLENNEFKKQDIIPVSLEVLEEEARKISLEAIGVAASNHAHMPVSFDFLETEGDAAFDDPDKPVHVVLGNLEFDISPNSAKKLSLVVSTLLLIPFLLLTLFVPMLVKNKQTQLDDLNSKLDGVNKEIEKIQASQNQIKDFDINSEIKKVLSNNRIKLMAYSALGESVPKNLYLTYFVTNGDGKIDIKGESTNVENIYSFYRNMKDSLINTQLRLHKLQLKSGSVDDAVTIDPNQPSDYEFEITNMAQNEMNPSAPSEQAPNTDNKGTNVAPANDKAPEGGLLNKPLLNFGKEGK